MDRPELSEQIDKGYVFPLLKEPKKERMYETQSLLENYDIFLRNSAHSASAISVVQWLGSEYKELSFTIPKIELIEKYEPVIAAKYSNLKIHQPL